MAFVNDLALRLQRKKLNDGGFSSELRNAKLHDLIKRLHDLSVDLVGSMSAATAMFMKDVAER